MNETKQNFINEYKKNLKINIANTSIVVATVLAMIVFLIVGYIYLAQNWGSDIQIDKWDPEAKMNQWAFLFLLPVCSLAAVAGVISVVASNNKAPIMLLILSTVSTLYKFSYALVQMGTGQESINASVLIGQPIMFFLLFVQVYYWIKWNKQTDEGKFISETFSGNRTYIAFGILGLIFLAQFSLSICLNGFETVNSVIIDGVEYIDLGSLQAAYGDMTINQVVDAINGGSITLNSTKGSWTFRPLAVFIDVVGAMLYTAAALLMAFGNILCFPLFFLSDLSWLYWTIKDLSSTNVIMQIVAFTTLVEVLAYTALAITGFIQWFNDDYDVVKKERGILIS